MTNQTTAPMLCSTEIEDSEGARNCDRTAVWSCRCSVRGGPLSPTTWRCAEHVDFLVEFWLSQPSTTSVSVVRQAGQ